MQKIALRYGLQMFGVLIMLFILIHFLGLSKNYHLRFLNGFVHLYFLFLAIRIYRKQNPDSVNNYVSGVAVGAYMTMVAVVLFGFCMILYLTFDQDFFNSIKEQFPYPDMFTPFTASLGIVVEGIAMSVIGSYIVTRVTDSLLEEGQKK